MEISVFDIFKVGLGPSSSHTVGPMVAARRFVTSLDSENILSSVTRMEITLFGSLALTGSGHGTPDALILGLLGKDPTTVDLNESVQLLSDVKKRRKINLLMKYNIDFDLKKHIIMKRRERLPFHPNGMNFKAYNKSKLIINKEYYSIGGGFVVSAEEAQKDAKSTETKVSPHSFSSAADLLEKCDREKLSVASLMLKLETEKRTKEEVINRLEFIWRTMDECIIDGCRSSGLLPGKLGIPKRAPLLLQRLINHPKSDPIMALDWVNLYAIAVNEENASGQRVVTAPTNGAAGIIPAVIRYFLEFTYESTVDKIPDFLLTAGAIGALYKKNASLSGAEVGCQGEVGVACSMAAAGLAAVLGADNAKIAQAAEIGMEHNLGLTCDPIAGLVQVPCIERNAMGAVKAINAARLAILSDGKHFVSLDSVIRTMRQTGADMKAKYKETSRGGLAVNVIEC